MRSAVKHEEQQCASQPPLKSGEEAKQDEGRRRKDFGPESLFDMRGWIMEVAVGALAVLLQGARSSDVLIAEEFV